ncbi:MAG: hypothetical protein H7Y20_02620, partial [Bryobacteraceae bacterium]|nr:hypothetical protein [Bryobacteraceae bacterium]
MGTIAVVAGLALLGWVLATILRAARMWPVRVRVGLKPLKFVLSGPYAVVRHELGYIVGPVLGPGEDERPGDAVVVQVMRQQDRLVALVDEVDALLDRLDRRPDARH